MAGTTDHTGAQRFSGPVNQFDVNFIESKKESSVTEQGMTLIQFEIDFADFKQNRMYPPGYRKETAMIALTMQHINAICHVELLIDSASLPQGSAKFRAKLEDDLLRLAELKLYIIQLMAGTPNLPYDGK